MSNTLLNKTVGQSHVLRTHSGFVSWNFSSLFILITLLFGYRLSAQTTSSTFDSTLAAQLQTKLEETADAFNSKGISVAVTVPEQGTWIGVAGTSYIFHPITPDMQFCIGSNTKTFTSALILKLVDNGILELDDHLHDWLPSYLYIDSSITIRQLLSHKTGLFDFVNDTADFVDWILDDLGKYWTQEEMLGLMGPPIFEPGSYQRYCNTNYLLASMIVEAATGTEFGDQMKQYIFDPLQLDSTFLVPYQDVTGEIAHPWSGSFDNYFQPLTSVFSAVEGVGNIYSTANEMAQWYAALFTGKIISEASLKEMTNLNSVYLYNNYWVGYYGLGSVGFERNGGRVNCHGGNYLGYNSNIGFDETTQSVVCALTNGDPVDDYYVLYAMLDVLHEYLPKKADDAGVSAITTPFGNYCSTSFTPQVKLKNFGSNNLTSAVINYQIDSNTLQTYNWSGNLLSDTEEVITLPAINGILGGAHVFRSYTTLPNGNPEGYIANDKSTSEFFIYESAAQPTPFYEGFETSVFLPPGWINHYPTGVFTWNINDLYYYQGHASLVKNSWEDISNGRVYEVDLPLVDLSALNSPELTFVMAYANNLAGGPLYNDSLQILISSDCGLSFEPIFNKGGSELSSVASSTGSSFLPTENDWAFVNLSLSSWSGEQVYLRLRLINGTDNNLFIDEVKIGETTSVDDITPTIALHLYPNPVHTKATLRLNQSLDEGLLVIYDMYGKEVKRLENINSQEITFDRSGMVSGVYVFQLSENGKFTGAGKFVVE